MKEEMKDIGALTPRGSPQSYKVGDIVQVDPAHPGGWGGCFVMVTEPKSWGIQGFVQIPRGGRAFIRLESAVIFKVGFAEWLPADKIDEAEQSREPMQSGEANPPPQGSAP